MMQRFHVSASYYASLMLLIAGCSTISTKPARDTPLPEGTDPNDLYNTVDGAGPNIVDARPYYLDAPSPTGAGPSPVTASKTVDPKREQQMKLDKNIPTGALSLTKARAEERRDATTAKAAETESKAKEANAAIVDLGKLGNALTRMIDPGLHRIAEPLAPEASRLATKPTVRPRLPKAGEKYDILVLSGGGSYGAYPAGIICGWNDCGTMPKFQVVTGVSTGTLVATAVFPGGRFLDDLRTYTSLSQSTLKSGDLWTIKRFPHPFGIGSDSVASNKPLRTILTERYNQPGYFEAVAGEHAAGRRLYVGTCNLDTMRFVIWDLGAIASLGTPESRKLYVEVVAASAAIPPLLSPSRITMTIDGRTFEELHVDGGTARSLFFYPPSDWPGNEEDRKTGTVMLAGARVHVIVSGKIYEDAEGTEPKLVKIVARSVGTMLSALTRSDLARLYSHCQDRDMVFRLAAVPTDYPLDFTASEFNPEKMTKLFHEGYRRTQQNQVWNAEPPERAVSEERVRRGPVMTTTPSKEIGPFDPSATVRPRR